MSKKSITRTSDDSTQAQFTPQPVVQTTLTITDYRPAHSVQELFGNAVANYLDIARRKAYIQHADLTFAGLGSYFTNAEKNYFYDAYNALWDLNAKVEAYTLMKMVFGSLRNDQLLDLLNAKRLMTIAELKERRRSND